ncbi:hypothetical protein [Microbacterium sp. W4I20]|uniref:hypothetical protein n=1 Tax=Microbacterium sp. W4I20 TaxID=3042262 RepID=UPI00278117F3|nr:hypothetical protein [Microbacterium sp. W4I20]MDQ0727735.1 hypothetical protein [Microbacterium sp. W4I20]
MYSFANVDTVSTDELLACFAAARLIEAAIGALERAGAALVPLIDDSDWQSEAVRSLHGILLLFTDRTRVEIGGLRLRQSELETVEVA